MDRSGISSIYTLTAVIILAALAACTGCDSGGKKAAATYPEYKFNTIVFAVAADAKELDPILAMDSASADVASHIFDGLVKRDKDLNLVGELADSWDVSEDGLAITFHLKKDVKWSDGEPFTADDVVFTYHRTTDPSSGSPYTENYGPVRDVTAVDANTVLVTYTTPFAPAIESWGMGIVPKHILGGETAKGFGQNPVGTGPYVLDEWKSGSSISLKANEGHYKGKPGIARILFNIIPDPSTRFMELKAGSVDYMGLTPTQYARQTDSPEFRERINKFKYQGYNYTYMGFNLELDKFRDKRVRKAISHAVDRKSVIDGVLEGLGSPCSGPFSPKTWAYNPAVKPDAYDPSLAKDMLAEAGWTDTDGDGVIDRDGVPFEFTIITNQGNDTRKKTAEIMQQNLKAVGIKVDIKVVEWQAFLSEFVTPGKFEAIIIGWNLSVDPDMYDIWHSSKTKPGEFNFIHYKNDEVDRLIMEGRETFDQEKRKAAYRRMHEIIADETPYVFLYIPDSLPVVDKRFRNIKVEAAGIEYNFDEWYIPPDSATWYE